jgi:hypothetical protein
MIQLGSDSAVCASFGHDKQQRTHKQKMQHMGRFNCTYYYLEVKLSID